MESFRETFWRVSKDYYTPLKSKWFWVVIVAFTLLMATFNPVPAKAGGVSVWTPYGGVTANWPNRRYYGPRYHAPRYRYPRRYRSPYRYRSPRRTYWECNGATCWEKFPGF